jgi:hypothetical protein
MKITKRILQAKGACAWQVARFAETFPRGTGITEALCLSVADKFDWDWAAYNLLSPESCAKYERIRAQTFERLANAGYERGRTRYERTCAQTFGRLAASE